MVFRILYLGNKLSKYGYTQTGVEYLGVLLEENGYSLRYAAERKSKISRLFQMIISILRNRKWAQIVIIDTYSTLAFYYAVISGFFIRLLEMKYIAILRGGNLPHRIENSLFLSNIYFKNSEINISPSLYLKEMFENRGYNVHFIPNPLEINNYEFQLRKKPNPKILWVRSFDKIYNPSMAIYCLDEVIKDFPEAKLCMVGPDKDGSLGECKKLAFSLGIESSVKFTGRLTKENWLMLAKDYDIFINTTNFDNMPVSVMEAMALGLPVVSTNVGGLPYLIDNSTGYLVEQNDVESMVYAIDEILTNSKFSVSKTIRARQIVESFNSPNILKEWRKLLNKIV